MVHLKKDTLTWPDSGSSNLVSRLGCKSSFRIEIQTNSTANKVQRIFQTLSNFFWNSWVLEFFVLLLWFEARRQAACQFQLSNTVKLPLPTENQIGYWVAGNFCQYWNLNSQITDNFDILIMVSNAKFQKKLNGQTRFA